MVDMAMAADMDFMNIPDYTVELANFKRSDEAREKLLNDVIEKFLLLRDEHNKVKKDWRGEQDIRRHYQDELDRAKVQLQTLQNELDNNSFVLALIDGDGVIFQDVFLKIGAQGGSEAASKLHQAIRDHIASIYDKSSHWPVMVQIYVSLDKLSQKLAQVGLLKNSYELRMFAQSFSVNQPLFSIVDVGQGKERADYRIKEMLRTFSDNPTCKHIIFGGCHDTGYLLNLDQYKHNEAKAARITLLESTTAAKGFAELPNFKRTRFDAVFRSEELPASPGAMPFSSAQSQPPMAPPARPKTTSPELSPVQTHANPARPVLTPSSTISSHTSVLNENSTSSWATVGKNGSSNDTINIKSTASPKMKYIYYNKEGHRLDEPLPYKDRAAIEAIEKRMQKSGRNLCNNFHLGGNCTIGNFCKFLHEPRLSAAELNALRYKTRSLACKRKNCENFDCYLGHQCAMERDTGYCSYTSDCNLRHTHGMDKTKYSKYYEDGTEEYC